MLNKNHSMYKILLFNTSSSSTLKFGSLSEEKNTWVIKKEIMSRGRNNNILFINLQLT